MIFQSGRAGQGGPVHPQHLHQGGDIVRRHRAPGTGNVRLVPAERLQLQEQAVPDHSGENAERHPGVL